MKRIVHWLPILAFGVILASPTSAEGQRRRDDGADRAQIEHRIRAQMGRMMQERLGLDAQEEARLSELIQTFESRRRELMGREVETRRRVEELTRQGGGDAEARGLLQLQADLRLEEAQLFAAEQNALLQVLTPAQVLELQDLREDLGRRIRALRGGGRGGEPNGPRGPGPRQDGRLGERRAPGAVPPLS
jgi:Spy/CpxP family protein refolding chaperone